MVMIKDLMEVEIMNKKYKKIELIKMYSAELDCKYKTTINALYQFLEKVQLNYWDVLKFLKLDSEIAFGDAKEGLDDLLKGLKEITNIEVKNENN
jgi:hypothetical protein